MSFSRRQFGFLTLGSLGALAVSACTSGASAGSSPTPSAGGMKTVTDLHGTVQVPVDPKAIVGTGNRSFRIMDQWGVKLVAAPKSLVPAGVSYKTDPAVQDIGNHNETKMEPVVATQPDLIIVGQRFAAKYEEFKKIAPQAAVVDVNLDTEKPLADELKRHAALLGEIFGHQQEGAKLAADLDAAIARAKAAYKPEQKVVGLITSGGNISYAAPGSGRAVGPLFPMLGLTAALEREGSDNHQGDDISVEAIAQANPDWLLVLDRDAAVASAEGSTTAEELIAKSEALANVTAIKEGNIVYMPPNFYVAEDILNYTDYVNQVAEAFEKKA